MANGTVVAQFDFLLSDEVIKNLRTSEKVFKEEIEEHGKGEHRHMLACLALEQNEDNKLRLLVSVYNTRDQKTVETETPQPDTTDSSTNAVVATGTTGIQAIAVTGSSSSQTNAAQQGHQSTQAEATTDAASSQTAVVNHGEQSTQAQAVTDTVSSQTKVISTVHQHTDTKDMPKKAACTIETQTDFVKDTQEISIQTITASFSDLHTQTEIAPLTTTETQTEIKQKDSFAQAVVGHKDSFAQAVVNTVSSTVQAISLMVPDSTIFTQTECVLVPTETQTECYTSHQEAQTNKFGLVYDEVEGSCQTDKADTQVSTQTDQAEQFDQDSQTHIEVNSQDAQTNIVNFNDSTVQTEIDCQNRDSQTTILEFSDNLCQTDDKKVETQLIQTDLLADDVIEVQKVEKEKEVADLSEQDPSMEPQALEDGPPQLEKEVELELAGEQNQGANKEAFDKLSQTDPVTIIVGDCKQLMERLKNEDQFADEIDVIAPMTGKRRSAAKTAAKEVEEAIRNMPAPKLGLKKLTRVIEQKKAFSPAFKEKAEKERQRIVAAQRKHRMETEWAARQVAAERAKRAAEWAEDQTASLELPPEYEPVSPKKEKIASYSSPKGRRTKNKASQPKHSIQFFDADKEEKFRPRPMGRNSAPLIIEPLIDPNPDPENNVNGEDGEKGDIIQLQAVEPVEIIPEGEQLGDNFGHVIELAIPIISEEGQEEAHIVEIQPVEVPGVEKQEQEMDPDEEEFARLREEEEERERLEQEKRMIREEEERKAIEEEEEEEVQEPVPAEKGLGKYSCPLCPNEYMTAVDLYRHMPLKHTMPHYAKVVRRRRSRKTIILEKEQWEKVANSSNKAEVKKPPHEKPRLQEVELTDSEDEDQMLIKRDRDTSLDAHYSPKTRTKVKKTEESPTLVEEENVVSLGEEDKFRCPLCRKHFPKTSDLYVHLQNTHKSDRHTTKIHKGNRYRLEDSEEEELYQEDVLATEKQSGQNDSGNEDQDPEPQSAGRKGKTKTVLADDNTIIPGKLRKGRGQDAEESPSLSRKRKLARREEEEEERVVKKSRGRGRPKKK